MKMTAEDAKEWSATEISVLVGSILADAKRQIHSAMGVHVLEPHEAEALDENWTKGLDTVLGPGLMQMGIGAAMHLFLAQYAMRVREMIRAAGQDASMRSLRVMRGSLRRNFATRE